MDNPSYVAIREGERDVLTRGVNLTRVDMWYILCALSDDCNQMATDMACEDADCVSCNDFSTFAQRLAAFVSSEAEPMLPGEIN